MNAYPMVEESCVFQGNCMFSRIRFMGKDDVTKELMRRLCLVHLQDGAGDSRTRTPGLHGVC